MAQKYLCPKCSDDICFDDDDVSEGYFGACLNCDEDFYEFECIKEDI